MKSEDSKTIDMIKEEIPQESENIIFKKETKKGRKSKKAKLLEQEALAKKQMNTKEEEAKKEKASSASIIKNRTNYDINEQIDRKEVN